MGKFKMEYENYAHYDTDESFVTIKDVSIKTISISYDGGRLYVSVNGEDIYENLGFGNDASVSFTKVND